MTVHIFTDSQRDDVCFYKLPWLFLTPCSHKLQILLQVLPQAMASKCCSPVVFQVLLKLHSSKNLGTYYRQIQNVSFYQNTDLELVINQS